MNKEAFLHISHRKISRTTHKPGRAAAHILYIGRPDAADWHSHDGSSPQETKAYINKLESGLRKNGRVLDTLDIALPRGITLEEGRRIALDFAKRVCEPEGQQAHWWLALHTNDWNNNPHFHLAIHDRDKRTGKPVFGTSKRGSSLRFRTEWTQTLNDHLAALGRPERADPRSFKARGIDQTPQLHVGPGLHAMVKADKPLPPNNRLQRNQSIRAARWRARMVMATVDKAARAIENIFNPPDYQR